MRLVKVGTEGCRKKFPKNLEDVGRIVTDYLIEGIHSELKTLRT